MNKKFLKILFFFSLIFAFSACTDDSMEPAPQKIVNPEMHAPDTKAEKITFSGQNYDFNYEVINGNIIFEGDIIISEEELEEMKIAANAMERGAYHSHTNKRWKDNIVPFQITDNSLNGRVNAAMNAIEAATNIVFRQRNSKSRAHRNYIRFVVGDGCSSAVGMQGGRQDINLAPGCTTGNTIHEICHALGMWHEQTRNDRDDNVIVNEDNIQNGRDNNFDQNNCTIDSGNFDFNSIMMYGPCFFAEACLPDQNCNCTPADATITTLAGNLYGINRAALSPGDIAAINEMYPPHWCTNTPCCGVHCIQGYVCVDGDCVFDPWFDNCDNCLPGEECINGYCQPY